VFRWMDSSPDPSSALKAGEERGDLFVAELRRFRRCGSRDVWGPADAGEPFLLPFPYKNAVLGSEQCLCFLGMRCRTAWPRLAGSCSLSYH
jgi:hypothetical protein